MTATSYVAQDHANVVVQGPVHGDVYNYQVAADASPETKFVVGVRYLDAHMPSEARLLIEEAVARGYETDEVRFHRLLARLSKRTLRELGQDDVAALEAICADLPPLGRGDEWTAGLRSILRLVGAEERTDTHVIVQELDGLGAVPRDKILDHLGVLIEGAMADQLAQRSIGRARANRLASARTERVWKFFEPVPAAARVRVVREPETTAWDWARVVLGAVTLVLAVGAIGRLLVRAGDPVPLAALVVAVAGGTVSVVKAVPWHFRRGRLRAREADLVVPRQRASEAPERGFARGVDRLFDHYFACWVPRDTDREFWLTQTAGVRRRLRDEVVEIYREQGTKAEEVAWLVRHLVDDVRQRWQDDTLTAHRALLRTPLRVKAACVLGGIVAAVAMGGWVVPAAVVAAPLAGTGLVLLAIGAAVLAVRVGLRVTAERLRFAADEVERAAELSRRRAGRDRWQARLSDRPTDQEMAG